MANKPPVELTVDQQALGALRRAIAAEEDSKALVRDLNRNLRKAVAPAVVDAQAAVRSLPAVTVADPPLRETVASQIRAVATSTGRSVGVKVAVGRKRNPRGFRTAARALNNPKGWRHPVYGHDVWVNQTGQRWFEPAVLRRREEYRQAVLAAMEDMAKRLADRVRSQR